MPRVFGSIRYWLPALAVVAFILAMVWAKGRDPFERIEFSLKTGSGSKVKGIAVLPQPVAKHPVVIYVYGAGGTLLTSGKELRQLAELGLAAVGIEYNQTNQAAFNEQFIALLGYLKSQSWALTNATAWVGFSLGAQRTLSFALAHPEVQPQLMVRMGGRWIQELDEQFKVPVLRSPDKIGTEDGQNSKEKGSRRGKEADSAAESGENVRLVTSSATSTLNPQLPAPRPRWSTSINCPVLLVHGEQDTVFPLKDCQRLADLLRSNGVPVNTLILPGLSHNFGENRGMAIRAIAEYCAERLPLTDYAAAIAGCDLTPNDARRFNLAMRRAGQHRRELWRAVTSSREPERRTVMNVIEGMEDRDLAHISAGHLRKIVQTAWEARRKYPWCRDTPLEIFEKFVANPRIYEEPLEKPPLPFVRRPMPRVKYCRNTGEASDAVSTWLYRRFRFRNDPATPEATLRQLTKESGFCKEAAMIYTYIGRSVGLPMRTAYTIWPTLGSWHWFSEVWSAEEKQWHAVDSANPERLYHAPWVLRVPKASILSTTGERGGWNALSEHRWEAFTNSIGLFYPSGQVIVRVMDQDQPVRDQRVVAQMWLKQEVISLAAAWTDENGEARLTLGQSARHPYRLLIDKPGETDWQWLAVQSNQTHTVTLNRDKTKPFDKAIDPPPLNFSK